MTSNIVLGAKQKIKVMIKSKLKMKRLKQKMKRAKQKMKIDHKILLILLGECNLNCVKTK